MPSHSLFDEAMTHASSKPLSAASERRNASPGPSRIAQPRAMPSAYPSTSPAVYDPPLGLLLTLLDMYVFVRCRTLRVFHVR